MIKYLALLRGINVGGKHIVKMPDLKSAFVELGCANVRTYIQSGNVLFETGNKKKESVKEMIEIRLKEKFGFEIPVILRTADELQALVAADPFQRYAKDPGMKFYVYFLDQALPAPPDLPTPVDKEGFRLIGIPGADALVVRHPVSATDGYADKSITRILKGMYTARNWNTVLVLAGM